MNDGLIYQEDLMFGAGRHGESVNVVVIIVI